MMMARHKPAMAPERKTRVLQRRHTAGVDGSPAPGTGLVSVAGNPLHRQLGSVDGKAMPGTRHASPVVALQRSASASSADLEHAMCRRRRSVSAEPAVAPRPKWPPVSCANKLGCGGFGTLAEQVNERPVVHESPVAAGATSSPLMVAESPLLPRFAQLGTAPAEGCDGQVPDWGSRATGPLELGGWPLDVQRVARDSCSPAGATVVRDSLSPAQPAGGVHTRPMGGLGPGEGEGCWWRQGPLASGPPAPEHAPEFSVVAESPLAALLPLSSDLADCSAALLVVPRPAGRASVTRAVSSSDTSVTPVFNNYNLIALTTPLKVTTS
jgi:hypothetical protein